MSGARRSGAFGSWLAAVLLAALLAPAGARADANEGPAHDPLEGFNRGIFWFNERLDRYFLEPVATGWDFVMPHPAQTGLRNFFNNLNFPVVFVNNLLQAKPVAAVEELGAFLLNSTLGMGGFIDARKRVGMAVHNEDFGQTLGVWGVPMGPYLVLPLLGPSSPRDAAGIAVDSFGRVYTYFAPFYVSFAATSVNIVNRRSLLLDEIRDQRASAFDYYAFVRNAYVSYRRNQVLDREEPEEPEESAEDLYYLDEDE